MKGIFSDRHIFWGLLILVHMFAWVYQIGQQAWYLADSVEYWQVGENLWDHGVMYCGEWKEPIREDFFTKRPPVYPLILTVFQVLPKIIK